ncbi:non-homologous end joining protein Ku [Nocardiopsis coralliicola]
MPNPVWTGTLSFGMVSLAVKLFAARERHGPTMHQFERGTSDRIRYQRVNERTGKTVDADDIVRGAKTGGGDYVLLEKPELKDIMPERSKAMEITGFVPAGSVDPLWYSNTYYVGADEGAAKPYRLLCSALEQTGRLGIATVVMRDREHLVLVGPQQGVLSASTLWWHDEVRPPSAVLDPPAEGQAKKAELDLAAQLIEAMAVDFRPEDYSDTYEERLEELIDAKAKGRTVHYRAEKPAPKGTVVELSDALRESLQKRRAKRGKGSGKGAPSPRRSPEGSGHRTKKELQAEAAELGVRGRSSMTRDELAAAVSEAREAS